MLFTIDTVVAMTIFGWVIGMFLGHAAGYGRGKAFVIRHINSIIKKKEHSHQ